MKRATIALIMVCVLMVVSLCGCSGTAKSEPAEFSSQQIPAETAAESEKEPEDTDRRMNSVDEINNAVGCCLNSVKDVYEEITEESFLVTGKEPAVARYSFRYHTIPVIVSASVSEGDISGIETESGTKPTDLIPETSPYDIVDTGKGLFTRWFIGGMQYCILVGDGKDYSMKASEIGSLVDIIDMFRDYEALRYPWYEEYYDYDVEQEPSPISVREELRMLNQDLSAQFGTGSLLPYESLLAEDEGNTEGYNVVEAWDVDSFLSAIAPNTEIRLAEGVYNLSEASDYGTGKGKYYHWVDSFDGYELVIESVSGLTISGTVKNGDEGVRLASEIQAVSRYAEVVHFSKCRNLTVKGVVFGHTEAGECTGGVLMFDNCRHATVKACDLYGCGTYGIEGSGSEDLAVSDTIIHDCSYGHVDVYSSRNILFSRCSFLNTSGYSGSGFYGCRDIEFEDCDFAYNYLQTMFYTDNTGSVTLKNCLIAYNSLEGGIFGGDSTSYSIEGGADVDYSSAPGEYSPIAFG